MAKQGVRRDINGPTKQAPSVTKAVQPAPKTKLHRPKTA
ncbi:hypothetical protein ERK16_3 [Mycobacterium phage Erk16]|nr:hypothetical protein ERK16_3 [Mycobacterium phage Erk16]QFP95925.1 hypothetical protein SEA_HELPFUL_3 [Mycobacterium phage Helpful]